MGFTAYIRSSFVVSLEGKLRRRPLRLEPINCHREGRGQARSSPTTRRQLRPGGDCVLIPRMEPAVEIFLFRDSFYAARDAMVCVADLEAMEPFMSRRDGAGRVGARHVPGT